MSGHKVRAPELDCDVGWSVCHPFDRTGVQRGVLVLSDFLLSPALLLSVVTALILAAVFHLLLGRTLRDLLLFMVASVVGFGIGQLAGRLTPMQWLAVGDVHMLEGILCALLSLFVARRWKV